METRRLSFKKATAKPTRRALPRPVMATSATLISRSEPVSNTATVAQTGDINYVAISQGSTGLFNLAGVTQSGNSNTATVSQQFTSVSNTATIGQTGNSNKADIVQKSSSFTNTAGITQSNNSNTATVAQQFGSQ